MHPRRADRRRRAAGAITVALALHLGLVAAWRVTDPPRRDAAEADRAGVAEPVELAAVALVEDAPLGPLAAAELGDADRVGEAGTHPQPRAELDAPGERAAAAGAGAPARDAVTGRRDRDTRSAQIWNHAERVRAARVDRDRRPRSPEAISRDPARGFDDLRSRPQRARRGDDQPRAGAAVAAPQSRDWLDADPLFDAPERPRPQVGATQGDRRRPLVERGELAVDAHRRGRPGDDLDSAARSSERHPGAFERTRPGSGGAATTGGAGARTGSSGVVRAGAGPGSAATTADAPRGAADRTVRARRQDPYFRDMYRRIDAELRFPRERALALDHGRVILAFTLDAGGRVHALEVERSSGFADFDREAVRALEAAAPFGPPPPALLRGAASLRVRAPYEFDNPLIR